MRQRRTHRVLVLATRNPDKVREIAAIYAHLGLEIRPVTEWPGVGDLPEDGATYADNAASKARAAAAATGLVALADDSGIEIDALGGAPGARSRHFLGDAATDADRNAHVLALLRGVPDDRRTARYRAVVAVALPGGHDVRVFEGVCEGSVAHRPRGRHGFGYDPIFIVTEAGRTMAELPPEAKNRISHRARALRAAAPYVAAVLGITGEERPAPGANSGRVARGPEPSRRVRPSIGLGDGAAGGDR